ncbi:MAG: hypothetical protein M3P96_05720 [Actinomycetota bacterium]|nr:hypothetical protein [Actinomycetota bacterium]
MRLTPYRVEGRLLPDVQQVIPLPEAEDLMVRLRQRESAAQAATAAGGRDWTPYVITTPGGETAPLRKRRAVLELTRALHAAGVPGEKLATVLPGARFLSVPGVLAGEDLLGALSSTYPRARGNLDRWVHEAPLHDADRTWVLTKMWGADTTDYLDALLTLAPGEGFAYREG